MDNAVFNISLDVQKTASQCCLAVKKGDTARSIVATLNSGDKPYPVVGVVSVVFTALKPDGNVIYNSCTVSEGNIIYDFTAQTAASSGELPCEFRVYGMENKLLVSARFTLLVEDAVYSDSSAVVSASEYSALTQMVSNGNGLIDELTAAKENNSFSAYTWVNIPDNVVISCTAAGAPLDQSGVTFVGQLWKGTTPVAKGDNVTCSVPSSACVTAGAYSLNNNLTLYMFPKDSIPINRASDSISLTVTDGDVEITKTIRVSYVFGGAAGAKGDKGDKGDDGQSAYDAAKTGGYTGTQSQFYSDLAAMNGLASWFAGI